MELNKGFEFILESRKQANLLNKLGIEIHSKETSVVYYNGGLDIRTNKNIMLIFLAEKENGYIVYVCNGNLRVGKFIFYTNKEISIINKTWKLIEYNETIMFNQWRMLYYKDSVISEFIDPLLKAEIAYQKSLSELGSKQSQVEMLNEYLIEIRKKY